MKTMLMLALLGSVAGAAPAQDDPLRPVLACSFSGGLRAQSVTHGKEAAPQRTVSTSSGPMTVSVADSYRVQLAFPGSDPFATLKLERSVPGRIEEDRTAILAQLTSFAAKPNAPPLKVVPARGVQVMGMDQPALLPASGVLGMYTLIAPPRAVVASVYLLQHTPGHNEYADYAQYAGLRDRFLGELATCMGGTISAGRPVQPRS
jgi:hypothetical protein